MGFVLLAFSRKSTSRVYLMIVRLFFGTAYEKCEEQRLVPGHLNRT